MEPREPTLQEVSQNLFAAVRRQMDAAAQVRRQFDVGIIDRETAMHHLTQLGAKDPAGILDGTIGVRDRAAERRQDKPHGMEARDWHEWYAWRPVRDIDGRWIWLATCWRRYLKTFGYLSSPMFSRYQYRHGDNSPIIIRNEKQ